jgi:hypothetical protein
MARLVRSSSVHLLAFVGFTFLASSLHAQITNVTNVEATPIPGAGHDYLHMMNETVNPANGSLSVRIEVPVPKGRGLTRRVPNRSAIQPLIGMKTARLSV